MDIFRTINYIYEREGIVLTSEEMRNFVNNLLTDSEYYLETSNTYEDTIEYRGEKDGRKLIIRCDVLPTKREDYYMLRNIRVFINDNNLSGYYKIKLEIS